MSAAPTTGIARALVVAGIVALAAGALLSLPRPSAAATRAPLEIVLVDVSKSVVASAAGEFGKRTTARLAELAARSEASGSDVAIVAFGRDVRTVVAPQPARELAAALGGGGFDVARTLLEPDGRTGARETRLAAALRLARGLADERPRAAITVLGDGTYTGDDPARIAHDLAAEGVAITQLTTAPRAWNLALAPLEVARELESGAPIVVSTAVRVARGTLPGGAARVEFEVRQAGGVTKKTVPLAVHERDVVPVHADLGAASAGLVRIEAVVSFASGVPDAVSEDDRSAAVVRCGGTLVVGCVALPADSAPWSVPGLQFVAVDRDELATNLAHLDALVTGDTPLSLPEQRALASFVEHGGGWLDLAGAEWLRTRRRAYEPIHALAALAPDAELDTPRNVVFLLDASGSMAGPPFDAVRAALGALVDSALPQDDVSVRFFAADLSPPIHFGTAADRADAARRAVLDEAVRTARTPSGPTHILAALESVFTERLNARHDTLVLLLSDGREPVSPDRDTHLALLGQLRPSARARVVAVAPVADVDREFLTRVSDSFVDLADPSRWSDVFRREIVERGIERRARTSVVPVQTVAEPVASLARATSGVPTIEASARADATPGAYVVWTDDQGEPLAAFARRGAGSVVSLAFTPGSDWAPAWTSAEPLAPILRALARSERAAQPSLRRAGETLVLEHLPAGFPASARAEIRLEEGETLVCTFDADARGFDARTTRTAHLPSGLDEHDGIAFVRIAGGPAGDLELALERPRAREFAFEQQHFTPPPPGATAARASGGRAAHPLAPVLLLAGVCALAAAGLLGAFSPRRS